MASIYFTRSKMTASRIFLIHSLLNDYVGPHVNPTRLFKLCQVLQADRERFCAWEHFDLTGKWIHDPTQKHRQPHRFRGLAPRVLSAHASCPLYDFGRSRICGGLLPCFAFPTGPLRPHWENSRGILTRSHQRTFCVVDASKPQVVLVRGHAVPCRGR